MATFGCYELRDEGEEEESGFWVERFGENSLFESRCERKDNAEKQRALRFAETKTPGVNPTPGALPAL